MDRIDQHGFGNQPVAAMGEDQLLDARQAAEFLGIKRETLYAYASRGSVRSVGGAGRERRYPRLDLERLKARHDARSGHGAVAAGALLWGEPVLESAVTAIRPEGPRYRGHDAVALAEAGARFEVVAELLWGGDLDPALPGWPPPTLGASALRLATLLPDETPPLSALALAVPAIAARDPARFQLLPEVEKARARQLVPRLAASLGLSRRSRSPALIERALAAGRVARTVAIALGLRGDERQLRAIDVVLVVSADHELNPSTFAARVAASTGADLYACVAAALAALSGPRHGASTDRVEALVTETGRPARARAVVQERARRGEVVPGFGHTLYPDGDPRAAPLLRLARKLGGKRPRVATALALVAAMRAADQPPPSLDVGLVAVADALGLPPRSATGLFAVGRSAGWIAHILEQRAAGWLLRPRARYVGR